MDYWRNPTAKLQTYSFNASVLSYCNFGQNGVKKRLRTLKEFGMSTITRALLHTAQFLCNEEGQLVIRKMNTVKDSD